MTTFKSRLENVQIAIAYLMPRWLVRWCVIRATAYATTGKYGNTIVTDVAALEVLKRWDRIGTPDEVKDQLELPGFARR
jgi:hypothetical protein